MKRRCLVPLSKFICRTLPLPAWERVRVGLLWGLSLHIQDFEKYMLYFLLARSVGCSFVSTYGVFLLIANGLSIPITILSGWLTDALRSFQHRVLQIAAFIIVALLPLEVFFATQDRWFGPVLLQAAYQLRQMAVFLAMASVWKLLKIRIDSEGPLLKKRSSACGVSPEEGSGLVGGYSPVVEAKNLENEINNFCGNFGDLSCEFLSVVCLGSLWFANPPFWTCFIATSSWMFGVCLLYIALALSFRSAAPRPPPGTPASAPELATPSSLLPEGSKEEHAGGPADAAEVVQEVPSPVRSRLRLIAEELLLRIRYLLHAKVVRQVLPHTLGMWLLYILVTYPLTLFSALDNNGVVSQSAPSSSSAPSQDNLCNGSLRRLLLQGFVINSMYLVTSLLYKYTIVPCPPVRFFTFVFPFLAGLCATCIGLLMTGIADNVTYLFVFLVALAQVIPYYLQSFDFYLCNTSADEALIGFVLSVIWFGQQVLNLAMSLLLTLEISIDIIFVTCLVILGIFTAQALFMRRTFTRSRAWASSRQEKPATL